MTIPATASAPAASSKDKSSPLHSGQSRRHKLGFSITAAMDNYRRPAHMRLAQEALKLVNMSTLTHLLYLHGFRSSPQSAKARQMADVIDRHFPKLNWWCPALPPSPAQAAHLIDQGTRAWPQGHMAVIGSSLGGYYATWLAEQRHCKAVLINPAVDPARDLSAHIGQHTQWHSPDDRFFFQPHFIEELRALQTAELPDPERYLTLIATGDEVLDWREMRQRYLRTQLHIIEGSDHGLSDFEQHLPTILQFLGLRLSKSPLH